MTEATNVNEWRKKRQGVPVSLPSGNTCLCRPADIQVFLRRGMIPNNLLPLVKQAMNSGKAPDAADLDIEMDEETLDSMLQMFDEVVLYCVVEPKVEPTPVDRHGEPVPIEDRDQSVLYIDEVDFDDKQAIFDWAVSGGRNLDRFRSGQEDDVASVPAGTGVEVPAEPASGS